MGASNRRIRLPGGGISRQRGTPPRNSERNLWCFNVLPNSWLRTSRLAGSAHGVEGAARQAALTMSGDAVAVLAGGVHRSFPAGHQKLLERLAKFGLLFSELPSGSLPTRSRFLVWGRLLAVLSGASIVIEAGRRSSSLQVAPEARQLGRGVGEVPGTVTSVTSAGPHMLLRKGTAPLVASATGVEYLLNHVQERGPHGQCQVPSSRPPPAMGRGPAIAYLIAPLLLQHRTGARPPALCPGYVRHSPSLRVTRCVGHRS